MKVSHGALALLVSALVAAGCAKDPEVAKREFLQSGDAYAARQQHAEAVIEYRNALQQDPRFGPARLALAGSYRALGDDTNASIEFVHAADLLPDDIDVQVRAGNILLVGRRFEDALARADQALKLDPRRVDALVLRGNSLAGMSRLEDALTAIESAITTDPDRSGSYATLGAVQLVRGDRAAAEAAFMRAVEVAPSSVPARLALANFYLATQQAALTEATLKEALALDPAHPFANRALAYYYIGAGRIAEAEPHLKAAAAGSADANPRLGLAEYYVSQGRPDDARRLFAEIVQDGGPAAASARLRMATLDFSAGRTAEAARLVDEVLAADPSHTRALTARAELQAATGRLDEALATARRAVESDGRSALAHYSLGKVHLLRREPGDAITAFNAAIQFNPRLVPARVELAQIHLAAGRLEQAEQMVRSALAVAPAILDGRLTLARILLARNNTSAAAPVIEDLQRIWPSSAAVASTTGLLELRRNQRVTARAAFDRALTLDPGSLEALRHLTQLDLLDRRPGAARARLDQAMRATPGDAAVMLLASRAAGNMGDMAEAERLATASLHADPNALDAYGVLSRIYLQTNRVPAAIDQLKALAERQPTSVPVHTTLGILLQMQNRITEARAVFEHVVEIDNRAAVAANNLAWIHAEHGGDLDAALRLAQRAKARLPDRPEVNDTLGWVFYKKGLSAQAVAALIEATNGDPGNAGYQYHLGRAYAAVGDEARARAALTRALEIDSTSSAAEAARKILIGLGQ